MEPRLLQIGHLQGKSNWATWKYKIRVLLKGISGALEVIDGKCLNPDCLTESASSEEKEEYKSNLSTFLKADSDALIILTTNMTEETLKKIMCFSTAREVWLELHRLFDCASEDKAYNLCMQFFGFSKHPADDMATHLSKLNNLWNELKCELDNENKAELPDMFILCKILETLPEDYFSFKSSWMLMNKSERTMDNLTSQICAYERALSQRSGDLAEQEALVVKNRRGFNLSRENKSLGTRG